MGIRGLGFLKLSEETGDIQAFLNKFRETLFQIGAFGFENWQCNFNYLKKEKSSDTQYRLITFSDTPDKNILISHGSILVGDADFLKVLKGLSLTTDKKVCTTRIDGSMAHLGDFMVRYGVALNKDTPVGFLFDIEYLPVSKLSVDFGFLFKSVCEMMQLSNLRLVVPETDPNVEYSFKILGQDYMKLITENEIFA